MAALQSKLSQSTWSGNHLNRTLRQGSIESTKKRDVIVTRSIQYLLPLSVISSYRSKGRKWCSFEIVDDPRLGEKSRCQMTHLCCNAATL